MPKASEEKTGIAFWAPLIAASMALFIVVVDSTMMNVAVSWNIQILALGWSLFEGVGAAMVLPLAYALLVTNYSPKEQAIGFGILGGVSASAAAVGPILGGLLTTFASWRLGFAGEVIIAIAIFPFAKYIVEKKTAKEGTTLDWGGAVLSVIGLFSLVLGLILAGRYGWWEATRPFMIGDTQVNPLGLSPTPILVGIGLTFLAAFIHWQMRREKNEQTPLVTMRVLGNGRFINGVSSNIFQSMVITGMLFILPLYLQSAVGYSAMVQNIMKLS